MEFSFEKEYQTIRVRFSLLFFNMNAYIVVAQVRSNLLFFDMNAYSSYTMN